jgi:HK97 family phage portal protein
MTRLLDRLTRSAPAEAYWGSQSSFGRFRFGRGTTTGAAVTVDTAVELIPVYSAVNLISSAIGSLPCKVYSLSDTKRAEARSSRQWKMLHDSPNDEIAADEFWQWVSACLLLWGNAFIWKQRDVNGVVQQLWPIQPSRVMVGRESAAGGTRPFYIVDNTAQRFYPTDILHIRGFGTDGVVGYSPIQIARQQFANDIAQQEFLGTFLKNGLFSSAVFTHPNRLSKEAQDRLRDQIEDRSGWLSAGKALTLEEGADLKNLTMSLVDSEFVQLVKLGEHRVAQLYGLVPPHQWAAAGDGSAKSVTYQNSEFGGLEFVKWTLRQWLVRLESAIGRDQGIFPAPGPTLFPEFLVDALLRADTSARWTAYAQGFGKWINAEWIHEVENIALPEGSTLPAAVAPTDQPDSGMGADEGGGDGDPTTNGRKVVHV